MKTMGERGLIILYYVGFINLFPWASAHSYSLATAILLERLFIGYSIITIQW